MHRDFRLLLPLALATSLFLVLPSACGVGDARTGTDGEETGGGGGGGAGPDGGAGPGPDGGDTPAEDCDEPVTSGLPNGNHNAGLSCIEAGCHAAGQGGGPDWTIAGTVYDASVGGQPVAGATIRIIDGAGKEIELISAQNGNFYTLEAVTYPLQGPVASACPTTRQMPDPVQAGGGGCNQAGCHDANRRIALP